MTDRKRKRSVSLSATHPSELSDRPIKSTRELTSSQTSEGEFAVLTHDAVKSDQTRSRRLKRSESIGDESTAPSLLSMKSDGSRFEPINFGQSSKSIGDESTAPSLLSMKSDGSRFEPINFGQSSKSIGDESTAPSLLSMKSDGSRFEPINFGQSSKSIGDESTAPSVLSMKSDGSRFEPINFGQSSQSTAPSVLSMKSDGSKFQPPNFGDTEESIRGSQLLEAKKKLQEEMKNQFALTSDCESDEQKSLNSIYTELHVTYGESEGPSEKHLLRDIKRRSSERSVNLSDIFKPLPGQEIPQRTVLTKGIAGIGKSFSVQKFILDWAEEKANQDTDFVFNLAFREMNLSTENKSLQTLLTQFHSVLQSFKDAEDFSRAKVIVILDGLDESRFDLDFENKPVKSVNEVTSVGNLLTNLIQGNLLPNAKLWITSRPVATSQIPAEFIDMVTEIRGFSDPQKEDYFRKRFKNDSSLADRIISHIKPSQYLNIMCQIPIFCWIAAVLFQEIFGRNEKAETPQTLTEMMAHFLFSQTQRRSRKYDEMTEKNKERLMTRHRPFLLKLGKLAFVQLRKNNLIFYDEDLEECGIDIQEATIYSGFCNAVLRKEDMFSQKKVFFFVHLTIQEFFAALFVYDCFTNKNTEELGNFLDLKDKDHTLTDLLKMTVDKVSKKKNGKLYYFMRFLFGLVVEPNRRVLQGLLTSPDPSQDTEKKILTHLKALRRKDLSPDSCINLFRTMVEMRDHKVKDEIQEYLKSSDHSKTELMPLHCSALAYMLQVSENDLDEINLKDYNTSDEGRRRLIPAVRVSRKAILADCKVTEEWVEHLAFGLRFPYLPLRDLDLSNNDLKDSGVKLLCDGLSSQFCRLEKLSLSGCQVTEKGCVSLASALQANPSHLMELDLSYNNLGESGEKILSELKDDSRYKLENLNVKYGGSHRMKPGFKKYACELILNPNTAHKNLRLSEENRKVTWVEDQQPYPDHPERFDHCQQVLCKQGLDERCYWELEVLEPFNIGLTYETIGRKEDGDDCKLGQNNKSWSLICSDDGCFVLHSNQSASVSSHCSRSSRVGVYLDRPAGTLSFYRVSSDSRIHLYTYKETFNDPLYPAVQLHTHSSALFLLPTQLN